MTMLQTLTITSKARRFVAGFVLIKALDGSGLPAMYSDQGSGVTRLLWWDA